MLEWDDWRVVHAAWTHGSFTGAAEALGIGQATVSRRVARVEAQVGHALFDRHRTGLVPTEAARWLRPHLEALTAAARGLERALDGLETEARGLVKVAMTPGMAVDWGARLAHRVGASHAGVRLEVLADVRPRDLDLREADLALRSVPTERGDLLVRRLVDFEAGVYAAPSLLAEHPQADASSVPVVQYAEELADTPIAQFLASLGSPVAFSTNDYLAMRAAVVAGLGATVMSALEARELGLHPVPTPRSHALGRFPVYLVVHRALRHVPRVAAVIDALDDLATDYLDQLATAAT